MSKYICVYVAINDANCHQNSILRQLMQKAIIHTKGDIVMHIKSDNPALQLYEQLGFEAQYLELRLENKRGIA